MGVDDLHAGQSTAIVGDLAPSTGRIAPPDEPGDPMQIH